eukprot:197390-Pyramimonas_sp.AAC.1
MCIRDRFEPSPPPSSEFSSELESVSAEVIPSPQSGSTATDIGKKVHRMNWEAKLPAEMHWDAQLVPQADLQPSVERVD